MSGHGAVLPLQLVMPLTRALCHVAPRPVLGCRGPDQHQTVIPACLRHSPVCRRLRLQRRAEELLLRQESDLERQADSLARLSSGEFDRLRRGGRIAATWTWRCRWLLRGWRARRSRHASRGTYSVLGDSRGEHGARGGRRRCARREDGGGGRWRLRRESRWSIEGADAAIAVVAASARDRATVRVKSGTGPHVVVSGAGAGEG